MGNSAILKQHLRKACWAFPGDLPAMAAHVAHHAHAGQMDKAGQAYSFHCGRVAQRVAAGGGSPEAVAVAWLHDVIEDSELTAFDLLQHGFPDQVVAAVQAMTKRKGEAYEVYLQRVKGNELARIVKLADLADNMRIERIPNPTPADHARVEKYRLAAQFLADD